MKYKEWLTKYMTPFLLVSYLCIINAARMLVHGETGFGLYFIAGLTIFALCFILFDVAIKKLFKGSIKTMVLFEAFVSLILILDSLYLESRKSKPDPSKMTVEPVKATKRNLLQGPRGLEPTKSRRAKRLENVEQPGRQVRCESEAYFFLI